MILVLSHREDGHVLIVAEHLKKMGVEFVLFDPADYPANSRLTIEFGPQGFRRKILRTSDHVVDLAEVTAVWVRRPGKPSAGNDVVDDVARKWTRMESESLLDGLWATMNCLWLPARHRDSHFGYSKIYNMAIAASVGFRLPAETLFTNDPAEFLRLYEESGGRMVSKASSPLSIHRHGEFHHSFTHTVSRRDAAAYQSVRKAPIILQQYVDKVVELRVTVVGLRVFAAAINSQASRLTRNDWRHYDNEHATYVEHQLPLDVETRCVRLAQAMGLTFGTIDLILTPEGEYVFLEINPNGQWVWIEDLTGLPIAATIAEFLASASKKQEVRHASAAGHSSVARFPAP